MKNLFKLAALMCSAAIAASCGIANVAAVPCVGLDNGNYQYVRTVQASCNHVYVFGIGGLKTKTPMQDLLDQAKLQDGEALVNVTLSTHNKFCVFWVQRQYTIFGQVVRFCDAPATTSVAPVATSNAQQTSFVATTDASTVVSTEPIAHVSLENSQPDNSCGLSSSDASSVATEPKPESTIAPEKPSVASAMPQDESGNQGNNSQKTNQLKDIDGKNFKVPAAGGTFAIPVDSQMKYISSDVDWIIGYAKQRNYSVGQNQLKSERKATLTITDKERNRVKIVIIQAGK